MEKQDPRVKFFEGFSDVVPPPIENGESKVFYDATDMPRKVCDKRLLIHLPHVIFFQRRLKSMLFSNEDFFY